jgi:two-component system cell cycle sensor histidine kinase/response regulator CckA
VNNILAVILALGCRLERDLPENQGSGQDVRDIIAAVYRGRKLIQDLLDFARSGRRRKEVCAPTEVIERLVAVLERTAPKRVGLELTLDEELGRVECDPDRLTQMLMNICLNSIDAIADRGTITVATRNRLPGDAELSVLPGPAAPSYVQIDVSDTGSGMDEETRKHAFEPFFTTKEVGEGTGLGLSMVYGAVRELEGDVRIISRLGSGTTVRLLLPVCPSDSARRSSIPASAPTTLPGHNSVGG